MNTAILFDTMSIQQYVFGSNKLRDNLGASYIVEHIYKYLIDKSNANPKELDIGYIGGGNALFFTISDDKAKAIVKEYTSWLLYTYPGVSVAVAINANFSKTDSDYKEKLKNLFLELNANKGKYIPINTIASHGLTATCQFSSLSVEVIKKYDNNDFDQMSSFTASKRRIEDEARNEEKSLLDNDTLLEYKFPDKLDDLGQRKGEDSHIAVVHIDGNGFGNIFRELNSAGETILLSNQVKKAVREAFIYSLNKFILAKENNKYLFEGYSYLGTVLPIRPIILGGDDITFVCHGKFGIWFAEKFMEKFKSNFIDKEQTIPFSSCAGVAIVKTKYPFYRAYQLAEELCNSAKSKRKKYMDENNLKEGGNWIDFQLAYSGLGNTLEEIRKLQYTDIKGENPLYDRPYSLDEINDKTSFSALKTITAKFITSLPNSKIKDLREMLTRDIDSQKVFIEHLKHQHEEFESKFGNNRTAEAILNLYPFFDMIELLELYPTNLLDV